VVVGASDAGLAALETLSYLSDTFFSKLTLVSTSGMPQGTRDESTELKDVLSSYSSYSEKEISQLRLDISSRVVKGKVVSIDRETKTLTTLSSQNLSYDILLLSTGLQDTTETRLREEFRKILNDSCAQNKSMLSTRLRIPRGTCFLTDSDAETRALKILSEISSNETKQVAVYGSSMSALSLIECALKLGVSSKRIVWINPRSDNKILDTSCSDLKTEEFVSDILERLDVRVRFGLELVSLEAQGDEEESSVFASDNSELKACIFRSASDGNLTRDLGSSLLRTYPSNAKCENLSLSLSLSLLHTHTHTHTIHTHTNTHKHSVRLSSLDSRHAHTHITGTLMEPSWIREKHAHDMTQVKKRETRIECSVLLCASKCAVDTDIVSAVKRCGLVFDGSRIIVDHQFQTLDPCIYATGSSSRFSRRFRAKFDSSELNSREIGVAAANSILETIDPMLERKNEYDIVHHHHHHHDVENEEDHLPDLRLPKDTVSRLPDGNVLFVARHLEPAKPTRVLETQIESSEDEKEDSRLMQITLDRNQRIVKIVALAPHGTIETRNLVRLIGLQEAFLGSLVSNYENGKIKCFLDYVRRDTNRILYDHRFNQLLTQMTDQIMADASMRAITNEIREILKGAKGGGGGTEDTKTTNDDTGIYTSVILKRNKLIGTGGKSLSLELRRKYAKLAIGLLKENRVVV
jgi:hypothetical protein